VARAIQVERVIRVTLGTVGRELPVELVKNFFGVIVFVFMPILSRLLGRPLGGQVVVEEAPATMATPGQQETPAPQERHRLR
jgi:hypothetical protein